MSAEDMAAEDMAQAEAFIREALDEFAPPTPGEVAYPTRLGILASVLADEFAAWLIARECLGLTASGTDAAVRSFCTDMLHPFVLKAVDRLIATAPVSGRPS